jgi:hypothetical protein
MEEKFCASFRKMPRGRNTKIGEIDVRSDKDIPGFEKLVMSGPLTLVYVHADFCGHCKNFSENVWSKVPKTNMPINAASVHYDMLDKTSLKNAKIEGYPSLLLVGKNKQPAEFKDETGNVTNAMTEPPKTAQELEQLLSTPIPKTVNNANSVVKTVVNNMSRKNSIQPSVSIAPSVREANTPAPELMTSGEKRNVFKPVSVEALEGPPDTLTDLVNTQKAATQPPKQLGGSLMGSLLEISREGAPAALLMASAAVYAHRRKSRKSKRSLRSVKKSRKSRR